MIEVHYTGQLARLRCQGSLGAEAYSRFLQLALDWPDCKARHLIFDCSQVEDWEALAYRGLVQLANAVLVGGGQVVLVALAPRFRQQLSQAHMEDCFLYSSDQTRARQVLLRYSR